MRKFIEFLHGDGCGCGCGDHEEAEVITLEFDDGEKIDCEIIGIFEMEENGKEYIALAELGDKGDVHIYRYMQEGKDNEGVTFTMKDIEDEAEFEEVCKVFDDIMNAEEVSKPFSISGTRAAVTPVSR